MLKLQNVLAVAGLFFTLSFGTANAGEKVLVEYSKGDPKAPITVIEYSSITCSHCAHFFNEVFPEIEERYIKTGKVRFIFREFPIDGVALKGAALAHCLPKDKFFPFITVLYRNREAWLSSPKPEDVMVQYAKLAGLSEEKTKACLADTDLMDVLVKTREEAMNKYNIQATPTFIINDGQERIVGARRMDAFATAFEKILAEKKK